MIRLAEWEKKLLPLALETPRTWGLWIVRRNEPLLKAALNKRSYTGEVGCPHCIEAHMHCMKCSWERAFHYFNDYLCTTFPFGRIKGDSVKGVDYWQEKEQVSAKHVNPSTISYLKAHILWGQRIYDGIYTAYANQEKE